MEAWQLTLSEYEALADDERYALTTPAGGANPSNSNYHLCAVLFALENLENVPQMVLDSYGEAYAYTFQLAREKKFKELERLILQKAILESRNSLTNKINNVNIKNMENNKCIECELETEEAELTTGDGTCETCRKIYK